MSDSSDVSPEEVVKPLSTSESFHKQTLEPNISSHRYQVRGDFSNSDSYNLADSRRSLSNSFGYSNAQKTPAKYQSTYVRQLNTANTYSQYNDRPSQSVTSTADVRCSSSERQCSPAVVSSGAWYEHLPRQQLQKPPLPTRRPDHHIGSNISKKPDFFPQTSRRSLTNRSNDRRTSPHTLNMDVVASNQVRSVTLTSNKCFVFFVAIDDRIALKSFFFFVKIAFFFSSKQEGGVSTCDDVSELPSSSATHFEPDSMDSGLQQAHTYDDATYGDVGEDHTFIAGEEGDVPKLPSAIEAVLRGVWPFEKALWHSSPASVGLTHTNGGQVRGPSQANSFTT